MPVVVVNGAPIACTLGLSPSVLTVAPSTTAAGAPVQAIATVLDFVVGTNIASFGMCNSPANPAVQAATAAASGVFTPAPCVPVIPAPWTPASTAVAVDAVPALLNTATCTCQWAGVVSLTAPGQLSVSGR
ncbi:MAG: DUF4280 domain-containing protein [Jatrophihabitantaceae bacterium]